MASTGLDPQTRCSNGCPGSDICVDRADLRDLGHQLVEAEELTRTLRNRIAGVKSKINAKMDPVTRTLPVEVICRIFELFTDPDRVEEQIIAGCWETGCRSGPLTLGAVCRRWRDIVWSLPVVWTTLTLDCTGRTMGPELVRQWLERAAGQPLAIQFLNTPGRRATSDSEVAFVVIDVINQFSTQWRVLDLSGLPYELLKTINDSQYTSPKTPSQLTHICMAETRFPIPRTGILDISRKHRPSFLSFVSNGCPIVVNIDWSNVSRIHIARSMESLMNVLPLAAAAPLLHHMSIYSLRDDYGAIRSTDPVVQLTVLRHLRMEGVGSAAFSGNVFEAMALPSLQTLHIDSDWHRFIDLPVPPIFRIWRLLARSACPLLHLNLMKLRLHASELIPLLQCVPSLRTLALSYVYNAGVLFSMLSGASLKHDIQPFLPILSSLDIAAYETNAWAPLASIWNNNPHQLQLNAHNPLPEQNPLRNDLSVKIKFICVDRVKPEHYMDRYGLRWIVSLWETHGIVVPIEIVAQQEQSTNLPATDFYEQSYKHYCSGEWKDEKLHQSLMAMLSAST